MNKMCAVVMFVFVLSTCGLHAREEAEAQPADTAPQPEPEQPSRILPESWRISGIIDLSYMKESGDGTEREGYFQSAESEVKIEGFFSTGVRGQVILELAEKSAGEDTVAITDMHLRDMWLEKKGLFADSLRFRGGKMTVPVNQNYRPDAGITCGFTDGHTPGSYGNGFPFDGPGSINYAYGITGGYTVGSGFGKINVTTFEGTGGLTAALDEDNDSGMLQSYAVQWDNSKDAFNVNGFGLTAGYVKIENGPDTDFSWMNSVGITYAVKESGITAALEYNQSKHWPANVDVIALTDPADDDTGTLISAKIDVNKPAGNLIVAYEQFKGDGDAGETVTKISIIGEYKAAKNFSFIGEISDYKFKETDDADMRLMGAGIRGTF